MRSDQFFRNDQMPFVELRYTEGSAVSFKPHIHQTLSIGGVSIGEVLYSVDGVESILKPGSLAIINPETLHSCNPANGAERSFSMLYLDPAWCYKIQQSLWHITSFLKLDVIRIDDDPLYSLYCTTTENLMDDKIHLQEKEQNLFELLTSIFSIACRPQNNRIERTEDIQTLKQLLSEDLHKDFPLHSLAEELQANPYTLIRGFKAATGLTPHAYRMNCRIEMAKSLLREGRDIADTALECGFFDQSHFHRHFKAMTTITPREYLVNFIQ